MRTEIVLILPLLSEWIAWPRVRMGSPSFGRVSTSHKRHSLPCRPSGVASSHFPFLSPQIFLGFWPLGNTTFYSLPVIFPFLWQLLRAKAQDQDWSSSCFSVPAPSHPQAMDLFTAIKDALITRLRKVPWMDEETRKKAQDRVRPGERDRLIMCRAGGGIEYWIKRSQRQEESTQGTRVHQHVVHIP